MNYKRLHFILRDKWQIIVIDKFAHHIDAINSHTILYLTDFNYTESDVIRLTETISNFFISGEGVIIYYESGAELLITRVRG